MDRLNGIRASAARSFGSRLRRAAPEPSNATGAGSALVPVSPIDRSETLPTANQRPAAAFLAHLIATNRGEPQTRERRRAEPGEAAHAYELGLAEKPAAKGRALSRAM
jgi:hypothetical protein